MAAPMVRQILANAARNQVISTTSREFVGSSCYKQNKEEKDKVDKEVNPFYEKYADKIKELRRSDPAQLESKLDALAKKGKWKDAQKEETTELKPKAAAMPRLFKGDAASKQSLDSVIKLDMIKDLSTEEIAKIWKEYHAKKDCIGAVIPETTYDHIYKNAQLYPLFMYPLPRPQGYEFIFAQFQGHHCYFTSLVNYQAYQENAPIMLTMLHYTELQKDKGIVLMRGELDTSAMGVHDAAILANQLQLYYGSDNADRTRLLDMFNNAPNEFKHMDLITQFETIHMDLPTASPQQQKS